MTPDFSAATASFYTLGCKLNFAETSTMGKLMAERGITRAPKGEAPDICVVNTCSVTSMADKKGRQLIRHLHSLYPEATIVATGCYAQLKPEEVAAIEGVDIVLGSDEKLRICEYLDSWLATREASVAVGRRDAMTEFRPSCERGDRTRYFLKVQDGCDYFCTYCTIPYARGRSRSGSVAQMVEQAREAAAARGREIVLTGVNIGDFGRASGENFFDLVRALDAVEGIERYRISSIEPNLLTPEIIEWIATESRRFMPHFHIPLQSGSDAVLRLMNRRYDTALFADRIARIRSLIPDAFIGVDVIVGARGETQEEWLRSRSFIESLDVTKLHVFPYSERPGTSALALGGVVPQEEKHRRVGELTTISDAKTAAFAAAAVGQTRPVLWEQAARGGMMQGLTDNYLRVLAPYDPARINTVSRVRLGEHDASRPDTLFAAL